MRLKWKSCLTFKAYNIVLLLIGFAPLVREYDPNSLIPIGNYVC